MRQRAFHQNKTLEQTLGKYLSQPKIVWARPEPRYPAVVEYEAPDGRLVVCLGSGGDEPRGNAAMWVEECTAENEFELHCSHAEAPEPNFEGYVCKLRVEAAREAS